jgi:hypothetical protein
MIRRLPPAFLSMVLLAPLLSSPSARGQDLLPAASPDNASQDAAGQDNVSQDNTSQDQDEQAPAAKGGDGRGDGRIAVTRSDGSTGHTTPPDPKQIRKLVSYMRAGMKRADNADRQRQTRRFNSNRRAIKIRK